MAVFHPCQKRKAFHFVESVYAHSTRQQVRKVLLITLALNLIVAFSKVIIGLVTGALAITADGFHSMVDGSSNVVALVANRLAARPPDADHPYGHRRYETIAALGIGAFLLVTAWEIVSGALERLSGGGEQPELTPLAFAVMIATLGVNLFITTYETRAGRRLRSELLVADAAHTRTDVFVSLSVLVSMAGLVLFGWTWMDTAAALVIVVLILKAAWDVLRQTGRVLVDTAPYSEEQLRGWVEELPAVHQVERARSRGPADAPHIDIDIQVSPATTADETAAIASAVRERLNREIEGISEVEVHFVPSRQGEKDYARVARARADALGLSTHEVLARSGENGMVLEMHVEVPPGQSLSAAHERVSQLEQDVRDGLPEVSEVITHIEPAQTPAPVTNPLDHSADVKRRALALLRKHYPQADWHHLDVYAADGGYNLTMHVALPPQISLEAAHRVAEEAETRLRAHISGLERVTIHTEPPET